jgi:hypothetical protein
MRYSPTIAVLVLLIPSFGCDSGTVQRNGLDLTVLKQTPVDLILSRTDTGDTWSITDDYWNKLFRCYDSDGCQSIFVVKPAAVPPDGCQGWKKESRIIYIPDNRRRTQKWEINEFDIEPLPRGCADKSTIKNLQERLRK